jgi:polysaccharide pyruvyl transferase WcaK-like protein
MHLPEGTGVVVSSRYHALVLAASLGRPFVGLGDENKVRRLCDGLSMPFIPWGTPSAESTLIVRKLIDAPRVPERKKVEELRNRALRAAELDIIPDLCRSSTKEK